MQAHPRDDLTVNILPCVSSKTTTRIGGSARRTGSKEQEVREMPNTPFLDAMGGSLVCWNSVVLALVAIG